MATLAPGTRLGPHEIVSPIGAGGMGEVYKARDTRLDRSVAIKIMPEHLSKNTELRERFEREAKVISSLNHPHICTLHDIGRDNDVDYLVLELIEGESLADRLKRGPLKLEEALRIASQMADALAAAHRAGIVHRDLKPGNVMLTRGGAKLLDFGLAAQLSEIGTGLASEISSLPTAHKALTDKGTILGTFQYMSPEQVEGKGVDARTDIFALGVVLYEMVTGKRAFEATSSAKLIASILEREVEPVSPPVLDRVIRRAVAKSPDERWQSALDFRAELEWILTDAGTAAASIAASRGRGAKLAWALFGLAALAAAALAFRLVTAPAPERDVVRFAVAEPHDTRFWRVLSIPVLHALSPDGQKLVFTVASAEGQGLWVRSLNALDARPLPGTAGGALSFWSPDSRVVAYWDGRMLKKVGLDGSPPQTIAPIDFRGGTWNEENVILAGTASGGLVRVSASGGETTAVTELETGDSSHRWPFFLPDGSHFLFTVVGSADTAGIYIGSLDGSARERILPDASKAEYVDPGYLLFARNGALMAQPFDPAERELSGEAVPIAEQVATGGLQGYAAFSASQRDSLSYHPGSTSLQLGLYDRDGRRTAVSEVGRFRSPALSPDGRRVAVELSEGDAAPDIWILDLERGTTSRLTFDPAIDWYPIWSPDGRDVVFASNRGGTEALYRKSASGAGQDELLLATDENLYPTDWSRDGRYILYAAGPVGSTGRDIWALPLEGDREPIHVLDTEFVEWRGSFSPDGKWVAYNSDETGRMEVYIQSFPPTGAKWQISTNGGAMPRFSADGSEVTYVTIDGQLDSVAISGGEDLLAGPPRALFDIEGFTGTGLRYSTSADGQHFLFPSVPEAEGPSAITVVLDWPALVEGTER